MKKALVPTKKDTHYIPSLGEIFSTRQKFQFFLSTQIPPKKQITTVQDMRNYGIEKTASKIFDIQDVQFLKQPTKNSGQATLYFYEITYQQMKNINHFLITLHLPPNTLTLDQLTYNISNHTFAASIIFNSEQCSQFFISQLKTTYKLLTTPNDARTSLVISPYNSIRATCNLVLGLSNLASVLSLASICSNITTLHLGSNPLRSATPSFPLSSLTAQYIPLFQRPDYNDIVTSASDTDSSNDNSDEEDDLPYSQYRMATTQPPSWFNVYTTINTTDIIRYIQFANVPLTRSTEEQNAIVPFRNIVLENNPRPQLPSPSLLFLFLSSQYRATTTQPSSWVNELYAAINNASTIRCITYPSTASTHQTEQQNTIVPLRHENHTEENLISDNQSQYFGRHHNFFIAASTVIRRIFNEADELLEELSEKYLQQ